IYVVITQTRPVPDSSGSFAQLWVNVPSGLEEPQVLVSFVPSESRDYTTQLNLDPTNGSFCSATEDSSLPPTHPDGWKVMVRVSGIFPSGTAAAPWKAPLWVSAESSGSPLLDGFTIKPVSPGGSACFTGGPGLSIPPNP